MRVSETERLVNAVREALTALPSDRTSVDEDAKVATIAALRELSDMMEEAENDGLNWPDAGDLFLLASQVAEDL
jgi:hypothetical protein